MPTTRDIRVRNLNILIAEFGSITILAREVDSSYKTIWQIISGTKTKKGTPRGVGPELARRLEEVANRPEGWMDEYHEDARQYTVMVPLLEVDELDQIPECLEGPHKTYYPKLPRNSEQSFAYEIPGLYQKYLNGTVAIVDPLEQPKTNDIVLVKAGDIHFMRYIKEANKSYLLSLLDGARIDIYKIIGVFRLGLSIDTP